MHFKFTMEHPQSITISDFKKDTKEQSHNYSTSDIITSIFQSLQMRTGEKYLLYET